MYNKVKHLVIASKARQTSFYLTYTPPPHFPLLALLVKAAKASHDRISKRIDVSKIPSTIEVFQLYFTGGENAAEDKENYRDKLKTTKTPILIISGDHDTSFAVENWYPLTKQLPTSQLILLPQTGHAPQHQNIPLVVNYIDTFLQNTK